MRYLNHREHPRWMQFCRRVDGFIKVCRFLLGCVWDWGLLTVAFATRGPPPTVLAAEPTPEDNEDEEEYFTANEEEDNPVGFEYPMTDDED